MTSRGVELQNPSPLRRRFPPFPTAVHCVHWREGDFAAVGGRAEGLQPRDSPLLRFFKICPMFEQMFEHLYPLYQNKYAIVGLMVNNDHGAAAAALTGEQRARLGVFMLARVCAKRGYRAWTAA